MDMRELHSIGEQDLKIDEENLDQSAGSVPYKISKWLKWLSNEKLQYEILDAEYRKMYRDKYKFYLLEFEIKLTNREVLDIYLPADEELTKVQQRRKYSEEKMRYMEGVIKALGNMNFNISNMIKWTEFQHGR